MNFKNHSSIVTALSSKFGADIIILNAEEGKEPFIEIPANQLLPVCKFLKEDPDHFFDFLNAISGVDNGPEEGTMEVWYHLTSIVLEHSFVIKVLLQRNPESEALPVLDSVTTIWKTADWHERETYDLLGIQFKGHPDLRRILLPADWVGHPLRKDYVDQEKYHGVNIKYDR